MEYELKVLNDQFSIPGALSFDMLPGKIAGAIIKNNFGSTVITLAGAHVMSYCPHGEREVLWSSPVSVYEISDAMRGGIPICWPWFAYQGMDTDRAKIHGFARLQSFRVSRARAIDNDATELGLFTNDTPATRRLWPHAFQFNVSITLGQTLRITWTARNPGSQPYTYTGALHPYFAVSNVHDLTLHGLDGADFLDKNAGFQRKTQAGVVRFPGEVDNVYLDTTTDMAIEDPGYRRTIYLRKTGSRTSVVWNPGDGDAKMPDVGPRQHRNFVCVEAANAAEDVVTVAPGAEAQLGMDINVRPWGEP